MLISVGEIDLKKTEREHSEEQRRFKEIAIVPEIMGEFFTAKTLRIESTLPDDSRVVSCCMEAEEYGRGMVLVLTLCSKGFESVLEGEDPPRINPREIVFSIVE